MAKIKKLHSAGFKFKVALAAVIGELTMAEISQKFKIHNSQISTWKKLLLENGPQIFENNTTPTDKKLQLENDELYEQIGRLAVERDFLKKTLDL
jgi:transposase